MTRRPAFSSTAQKRKGAGGVGAGEMEVASAVCITAADVALPRQVASAVDVVPVAAAVDVVPVAAAVYVVPVAAAVYVVPVAAAVYVVLPRPVASAVVVLPRPVASAVVASAVVVLPRPVASAVDVVLPRPAAAVVVLPVASAAHGAPGAVAWASLGSGPPIIGLVGAFV